MRKKKIRSKLFIWIALLTFMLGVNSESVFAAETTQTGVIVETTFDKSSYQNEEKVIYSVYIQNTNSEIINIKDINFDIPDGYKLSEETANESIQNIQPGEHVLLKYDIDEKNTNNGSDNDNGNTKGDTPSDDNKDNTSGKNSTTRPVFQAKVLPKLPLLFDRRSFVQWVCLNQLPTTPNLLQPAQSLCRSDKSPAVLILLDTSQRYLSFENPPPACSHTSNSFFLPSHKDLKMQFSKNFSYQVAN